MVCFWGLFLQRMNFRKSSKQPLTPPPHFWKIILQYLYNFMFIPVEKLNLIWIIAILIWTMTWAMLKIEGGVYIDRIDKLGVASRLSLPNRQVSETTPLAKNLSSNLVEIFFLFNRSLDLDHSNHSKFRQNCWQKMHCTNHWRQVSVYSQS